MSEMTDSMTRKIFLDVCIAIEGLSAELYHYYSTLYEDIPEASRLWEKTALEEENHQKQFELARRLLSETTFDVSRDSLERAMAMKWELMSLMNQVKGSKPKLLTAIASAVEMEGKLADLHVHSALTFRDESMQRLFKALGEADRNHVTDMQRYQSELHLAPCEMEG